MIAAIEASIEEEDIEYQTINEYLMFDFLRNYTSNRCEPPTPRGSYRTKVRRVVIVQTACGIKRNGATPRDYIVLQHRYNYCRP